MRKVFRYEEKEEYWDRRWSEAERDREQFSDLTIYPIRYAELVMNDPTARALDLGAGLGRILKHYSSKGSRIVGLERSRVALERVRATDPSLDVREGDVRDLPFADGEFDVILAFGLFHNIEDGMDRALDETARVLRHGGRFCISVHPDNLEMQLNERYWRGQASKDGGRPLRFHKWLVGEAEFRDLLGRHSLAVERIYRARNVSLLYRVRALRARSSSESERRATGYRLNALGRSFDRILLALWPAQFCNSLVYVGHRI